MKTKTQAGKHSLTSIFCCCMPVKSRTQGSNLTPAGRPASPSCTEPFDRSPCPAGRLRGARRSGTKPPVTTGGARRCRRGLKHWHNHKGREPHIPTGNCSSSHTPDRDLLFTPGCWGRCMRMCVCVLIKHSSPSLRSSQCLVTWASLSLPSFFFSVCERKELIHSFLIVSFPPIHKRDRQRGRGYFPGCATIYDNF